MGVEKIIQLIEQEAADEAAMIVADAERDASESVAAAEATVAAQIAEALERLGPEIRAESQRRINAVRLRILEERARDDAERLTAVFDAAQARLEAIADGADAPRWSRAMERLCGDALESVGEGASIAICSRDASAIAEAARRGSAEIVSNPDSAPAGLVVTSHDGRIEVDASLAVRIDRARSLLAEAVARMLMLGPSDSASGAGT